MIIAAFQLTRPQDFTDEDLDNTGQSLVVPWPLLSESMGRIKWHTGATVPRYI